MLKNLKLFGGTCIFWRQDIECLYDSSLFSDKSYKWFSKHI